MNNKRFKISEIMKTKQICPKVKETSACTFQASEKTTQDQGERSERMRKWISQTPFASLLTALRNGTIEDQLQCMLQVERWLLQCHLAAVFGQYTRKQFFEEVLRISELFGLVPCSSLLRKYQRKTPRRALMCNC